MTVSQNLEGPSGNSLSAGDVDRLRWVDGFTYVSPRIVFAGGVSCP